jgi:hypothetical protein
MTSGHYLKSHCQSKMLCQHASYSVSKVVCQLKYAGHTAQASIVNAGPSIVDVLIRGSNYGSLGLHKHTRYR